MGVRGEEEVVGAAEKGCFCAVMGPEAGLEWFIVVIGVKVGFEL